MPPTLITYVVRSFQEDPSRISSAHQNQRPSNMSQKRLPWTPPETSLLLGVRSEMPKAKLPEITEAFNRRNNRRRSDFAVKAKLRHLRAAARERGT